MVYSRYPSVEEECNIRGARSRLPGPFGRLRAKEGRIDIKASGLLPIVAFARAAALHHGIAERSTAARLEAAAANGAIPAADVARLVEMHGEFIALAMAQQIIDIGTGYPPSYRVELRRLDRAMRRALAGRLSGLRDILSLAWSTLSA